MPNPTKINLYEITVQPIQGGKWVGLFIARPSIEQLIEAIEIDIKSSVIGRGRLVSKILSRFNIFVSIP